MNKGYLQSDRTSKGDECYTPFYAVEPILKYIPKDKVVWCPFDKGNSAFVQLFKEKGYKVLYSHIENGEDFFEYEPTEHYDIIISNPPYSCKDAILQRVYELGKPFMLLMPVTCIQGKKRVSLYTESGLQLLIFDLRVDYHTNFNLESTTKGCHFGSCYFCNGILPKDLVFEKLIKYERPLPSLQEISNEHRLKQCKEE